MGSFFRQEGRNQRFIRDSCEACKAEAFYRCEECYGGRVMCKGCVLTIHEIQPLHALEVPTSIVLSLRSIIDC